MFHTTDESIVQCGVERKRRPQRDHWGRMGWNVPTLVSDEPLEMRGGSCPTRQDGRWGITVETVPTWEESVGGVGKDME